MTSEIQSAIESAYRVFATYRVGPRLDFAARVSASREVHDGLHALLTRTPLRRLPLDAVDAYLEYIDAAHYEGGFRADELRYFLPRALELIAGGEAQPETPWLRERLERILARGAMRRTWPAAEVAAIDRLLPPGPA